jgi:hypothetical protein
MTSALPSRRLRLAPRVPFGNPSPSRAALRLRDGSCRRRPPVNVTNWCARSAASTLTASDLRPMKLVAARRKFPGLVRRSQRWELDPKFGRSNLEHPGPASARPATVAARDPADPLR